MRERGGRGARPRTITVEEPEPQFLEPGEYRFSTSPAGALRLELPDRCHRQVQILRCLPLSQPDQYLSVRCRNLEVALIRALDELEPDQRELVESELSRRYFQPVIHRIDEIEEQPGQFVWQAATDCGPAKFTTAHPRYSALRLGGGRWVITDLDGNRYAIADETALDRRSRTLLALRLG